VKSFSARRAGSKKTSKGQFAMVIWRGMGILALLVAILINVALNEGANNFFGVPEGFKHYRDAHSWVWLLGMSLSAAACWFLGRWVDARALRNAQVVTDKATGQDMHLVSRHDLFWIPIRWWSLVWLAVGVLMALK
jgi:hypothetical protein